MNIDQEIKALAARYGITETVVRGAMDTCKDLDEKSKLIWARLALCDLYGKQEYFSLEEIAHITGQTKEEAMQMMVDGGATPYEITVAPYLKGE